MPAMALASNTGGSSLVSVQPFLVAAFNLSNLRTGITATLFLLQKFQVSITAR